MGAGGGCLSLGFHIHERGVYRASSLGFEELPVRVLFTLGRIILHIGLSAGIESTGCTDSEQREAMRAGRAEE